MEQPDKIKCTYADCNFYFDTDKEMIRHKKKDPDHFYCHKCNEDYENDTEYMIHQILSPRHTVCPSCGMEFKSVSGRDRHVEISHSSSQRLPCRGCGMNFTRAASLMQHIEKDQCRVIRRSDFVHERAERSILKDAFMRDLDTVGETGASQMASVMSASSDRSSSVYGGGEGGGGGGGVSLLDSSQVHAVQQQAVDSAVILKSPLSDTSLNNFPSLPPTTQRGGLPSISSQDPTDSSINVNDISGGLSAISLEKASVWTRGQSHSHISPSQAKDQQAPPMTQGTDSKYDQLSEVSFQTAGSQSYAGKLQTYASQGEWNKRDQSVPPAAPRLPEQGEHVTTRPPPRVSRLDVDKFYDHVLRCYICPAIKCQGTYATAEQFRAHVQGPTHSSSNVICSTCLRSFRSTTALMSHMESGSKRCNARNTTNYNQLLREVSAGLIGTSGQLEDGSVKYSVPHDEGWGENPHTLSARW